MCCISWPDVFIDTRTCEVELKRGQFFQQGKDLHNPVFYFRNVREGLWRKDVEASIFAILHRFENTILKWSKSNSNLLCTIVVLMGKPVRKNKQKAEYLDESKADDSESIQETISTTSSIPQTQKLYVHTNFRFAQRLIDIFSQNYPEMLGKALVVPSGGWEKLLGHSLRRCIQSPRTRAKVIILKDAEDLKAHISEDEIVDLAGSNVNAKTI